MDDRGIIKSTNRENKRHRRRYGMRVSGRSTKSVILQTLARGRNGKTNKEDAAKAT